MTDPQARPEAHIVLLGPQRRPALRRVVAAHDFTGPYATITAGWQEREHADSELQEHLSHQAVNLALWSRREDLLEHDAEFAAAHRHRRTTIGDLQELYLLGVAHTLRALQEIRAQTERAPQAHDMAVSDAEDVLRSLDARHLERVREVNHEFWSLVRPHERDRIAQHRAEVAQILAGSQAVVMTGGHVAELLDTLHLFNLVPAGLGTSPIITWSAGAMVLTQRVILFNDNASRGPRFPEVYDDGLGLIQDAVVLPSAHQRLHMHDAARMTTMVRRFAPARCVPLDPGSRVDVDASGRLTSGTPVLGADGRLTPLGDARTRQDQTVG